MNGDRLTFGPFLFYGPGCRARRCVVTRPREGHRVPAVPRLFGITDYREFIGIREYLGTRRMAGPGYGNAVAYGIGRWVRAVDVRVAGWALYYVCVVYGHSI